MLYVSIDAFSSKFPTSQAVTISTYKYHSVISSEVSVKAHTLTPMNLCLLILCIINSLLFLMLPHGSQLGLVLRSIRPIPELVDRFERVRACRIIAHQSILACFFTQPIFCQFEEGLTAVSSGILIELESVCEYSKDYWRL